MSEMRVEKRARRFRILRMILGLFAAPIAGGAGSMFALVFVDSLLNLDFPGLRSLTVSVMFGGYYGGVLGLPVALIFGPLIHMLMLDHDVRRWHSYAAFGALIASCIFLLVLAASMHTPFYISGAVAASIILAGAIGGLTFWLIRRPDRDNLPGLPVDSPHDKKA